MTDLLTLTIKEIKNFLKIWKQTIVPAVITSVLYILIFGKFLWSQINPINGVNYINFVFPWLLMMSVIMWSYSITSFWFFSAKMFKSIEEILVSPMTTNKIIIAYILAWITRWVIVWWFVILASLFFINISINNFILFSFFIILTSITFALLWLFNAIFARSFDDVNFVPNFIMTPMIYLGWVFYSISNLSPFWQTVSQFNPIFYMINWLRHSFIWFSDVSIYLSISILLFFIIFLYILVYILLKKSYRIKS